MPMRWARAIASAVSARGTLGLSAVTATARSPRATWAALATTVLSMPPLNATATRPRPRRISSKRSRLAARSGGSTMSGMHLILCCPSDLWVGQASNLTPAAGVSVERADLLLLDERLRFDDGVLFREGVERGEEDTLGPGFDLDAAEGSDRQAVVGLEVVQEAALAAAGKDLVVHVQEDLRRQRFDLKAHLVDDAVSARKGTAVLASQPVVQQATAFRQGLVGGRRHFREQDIGVFPGDDVAGACDAQG